MPSAPPTRQTHLDGTALLTLLTCCTLWGLNQVAIKVALPEIPPLSQLALRCVGATLLVVLWAWWRKVPMLVRDGTLWPGLLAGALFAAEFCCIFLGLQTTTASRMTVFLYLAPFFVALGMPYVARQEGLGKLQWLGLCLAFAGVASAFFEGLTRPAAGPDQWLGDALGVLAAALWAATTLVIRSSRLAQAAPEKTLAYQLSVTAVVAAVGVAVGPQPLWTQADVPLSQLSLLSMLFQTLVVTFASYLAWFWLVQRYAATPLASFTLLTPMAGLLFGVILLSEPLTLRLLLAALAVAAGLLLINPKASTRTSPLTTPGEKP